jgi:hypothetical protein
MPEYSAVELNLPIMCIFTTFVCEVSLALALCAFHNAHMYLVCLKWVESKLQVIVTTPKFSSCLFLEWDYFPI